MQYTAINNKVSEIIDKMCAITEKLEKTRPSHWITSKMLKRITKRTSARFLLVYISCKNNRNTPS